MVKELRSFILSISYLSILGMTFKLKASKSLSNSEFLMNDENEISAGKKNSITDP